VVSKAKTSQNKPLFSTGNGEYYLFEVMTVFVLMFCYWNIDHDWNRSVNYADADEGLYDGSENSTADRLGKVNPMSTASRLLLAGWGGLCFFSRRSSTINWNSPLLWASLFFGSLLCLSLFWSIQFRHTLFKLTVLVAVVVSAIGFASRFPVRQLLEIICFVCIFFIGIGVLSEIVLGTFRPWRGAYRFIGTSHPNTLAIFAAFLCLSARLFLRQGKSQWFAILIVAIGVGVLLLAKSRTTLGGVLAAMLVTQIVSVRGSNRIYLLTGGVFAMGVIALASLFLNQQATGQLGSAVAMGRTEDVTSLTGRLPLWQELLHSINKRPMLGYGYLAYWDANRVEYLSDIFKWEIPHGHNAYLDVCLDVGVLGLGVCFVWLITALVESLSLYQSTNRIEYAIIFGLVVFAMVNGFGESLFKLPTFHLFALLCFMGSLVFAQPSYEQETPIMVPATSRRKTRRFSHSLPVR
jgi:exopolysaccharide production protein ExoQ